MAQDEDGLIVKIKSQVAGSLDKVVIAKSPIFVKPPASEEEEEKKGDDGMEDIMDEIPLQPDAI